MPPSAPSSSCENPAVRCSPPWPARAGDAAEGADDAVVDEVRHLARLGRLGPVRVEHLEEVAKPLRLRLQAKLLICLHRLAVEHRVVVERDAIQAQVRAERALL